MEPHNESHTFVLWDVTDFPVPKDHHVKMFKTNVGRAVVGKNYPASAYRNYINIQAYCEKLTEEEERDFSTARIHFYYAEKSKRLQRMVLDMVIFAKDIRGARNLNILVVAKDIPKVNTELFSVMEALRRRGHNVYFVVPDGAPESDFPPINSASSVWRWTSLFKGDPPTRFNTDQVGTSQVPQKRPNTPKGVTRLLAQRVPDPAWM